MPMGGGPKLLVPLVAGVAVVGVGALFFGQTQQLQDVKQRLGVMQNEVAQQRQENQSLTQQMNALQVERKSLEDRLGSVRGQLGLATTELEQSRTNLSDLTTRYEQITAERSQLQVQVATLTSERDESRMKNIRLEERNAEIVRSLSRMRERLSLLNRDYRKTADELTKIKSTPPPTIDVVGTISSPPDPWEQPAAAANTMVTASASGAVELPPIVVRNDGAASVGSVRGRLLDVNPAHSFVVVDKGAQDGVRVGMQFDILRGASHVGRATVVRVRPKLSACDVVRTQTPGQLQIGDTAVQSGP
jgi:hypothetical protein